MGAAALLNIIYYISFTQKYMLGLNCRVWNNSLYL